MDTQWRGAPAHHEYRKMVGNVGEMGIAGSNGTAARRKSLYLIQWGLRTHGCSMPWGARTQRISRKWSEMSVKWGPQGQMGPRRDVKVFI